MKKTFKPTVLSLENRQMLDGSPMPYEVGSFAGPSLVFDPSDQTGDTAFGLIGMTVGVNASIPRTSPINSAPYEGIWSVKFTTSDGLSSPRYSTLRGSPGAEGTVITNFTWESNGVQVVGPMSQPTGLVLGKTEGDVTIDIEVTAKWTKPGWYGSAGTSGFDILTDTLTVHSEAPEVIDFHLGSPLSPDDLAPGIGFHRTGAGGVDIVPNEEAKFLNFAMYTENPNIISGVGYWSTIYNDTHYDLSMGFLQEVEFSNKRKFSSGKWDEAHSDGYVLDANITDTMNVYGFTCFVPKGETRKVPSPFKVNPRTGVINPNVVVHDSPNFGSGLGNDENGWVQMMEWEINFETHVIIVDAYLPGAAFNQTYGKGAGEGTVTGQHFSMVPIALSTATWHMYGRASLAGNTDLKSTAEGDWSVVLDIGPGRYTGGNSTGPWIAYGDGEIKTIDWKSNWEISNINNYKQHGLRRLRSLNSGYIPKAGNKTFPFPLNLFRKAKHGRVRGHTTGQQSNV